MNIVDDQSAGKKLPTRTAPTDAAYATRYRQLYMAARSDAVLAATKTGLQPSFTASMGRGILLWLLGVPIPIIILLAILRLSLS